MIWHRLRGHKIEPYRVITSGPPWRWQCSCGKTFGGKWSGPSGTFVHRTPTAAK